jgi:hypothetical protein
MFNLWLNFFKHKEHGETLRKKYLTKNKTTEGTESTEK